MIKNYFEAPSLFIKKLGECLKGLHKLLIRNYRNLFKNTVF